MNSSTIGTVPYTFKNVLEIQCPFVEKPRRDWEKRKEKETEKGRKKGGRKGKRADVPKQTKNAKKRKTEKRMKIIKFEEKIFQ